MPLLTCDRFGNYIGEPEESEVEEEVADNVNQYMYDDEADEGPVVNDQQLMEVDGEHWWPTCRLASLTRSR